jgi:hypothetical protein
LQRRCLQEAFALLQPSRLMNSILSGSQGPEGHNLLSINVNLVSNLRFRSFALRRKNTSPESDLQARYEFCLYGATRLLQHSWHCLGPELAYCMRETGVVPTQQPCIFKCFNQSFPFGNAMGQVWYEHLRIHHVLGAARPCTSKAVSIPCSLSVLLMYALYLHIMQYLAH